MIYPSGRAGILAAAVSVPAFAIAVAVPQYWYAGLIGVILIVALTAVDALAAAPKRSMEGRVAAPPGAYVGQDIDIAVTAPPLSQRVEARVSMMRGYRL